MRRRLFFLGGVVWLLLGTGAAAVENVDITADTLSVHHEEKRAHFEGHVTGTIGALRVRCARLELAYNDAGEVDTLHAVGGVTVVHGESTATAASARLDVRRGVLILEGKPVLTRGPHRLEGRRIEVHLNTGRLEVIEAKGRFRLKKEGK